MQPSAAGFYGNGARDMTAQFTVLHGGTRSGGSDSVGNSDYTAACNCEVSI